MSGDYDNTNRGTLGRNTRREKDTQPEYTGKCDIDGTMYWISAWVKEANGSKFFSLSFKPQEAPKNPPAVEPAKQTREQQRARAAGFDSYDDDDSPF